jgi:hypothetical protein
MPAILRRGAVAATLVAVLALPGAARAQNLLENGGFSTLLGLDGWGFAGNANAIWSGSDATGIPLSGSAFVENATGVATSLVGGLQCIAADENTVYQLRGAAYIPASDEGESGALIDIAWVASDVCVLPALRFDAILDTEEVGSWIFGSVIVTSPPGTTHAAVDIRVHQLGSPPDLPGAYFDALYVPEPSGAALESAAGAAFLLVGRRQRSRSKRESRFSTNASRASCESGDV